MEALNIRELGGHAAPAASPGGKSGDKKLLGSLVLGSLNPFLEQLRMMYSDAVSDGESYLAGKSEDFKETTKRLKAGLFVFLNTGNYASHNRGKLSFCQQVELCGAVGAMAETLPVVFEACQVVKGIRTSKSSGKTSPTKRGTVSDDSHVEAQWQINLAAYYRKHLIDSSRAKYEATLAHMEMVPEARLCVNRTSCSRDDCAMSHSTLEARTFNPLVVTLKCPVSENCWGTKTNFACSITATSKVLALFDGLKGICARI
ncbi:hypothetical protein PI125_g9619 [Phytophthora idaei]|nr:hypothetical protein PI125_g9619 [Phytophthora idaei]